MKSSYDIFVLERFIRYIQNRDKNIEFHFPVNDCFPIKPPKEFNHKQSLKQLYIKYCKESKE